MPVCSSLLSVCVFVCDWRKQRTSLLSGSPAAPSGVHSGKHEAWVWLQFNVSPGFMCIAVQASAAQQRWACDGNAHVCLYAVVWFVCTQLQLDSAEHMKAQDTNSITLWLEVQFFTSSHFIWRHFSLHYCLIMCLCKNTAAGATEWPKFKASNHLRKSSNQWSEACVPSCNDRPGRVTALHT